MHMGSTRLVLQSLFSGKAGGRLPSVLPVLHVSLASLLAHGDLLPMWIRLEEVPGQGAESAGPWAGCIPHTQDVGGGSLAS